MLFLWLALLLIDRWLEDADIGQIAVALCIVQTIAHNKIVRNGETEVIDRNLSHTFTLFIEE